MKITKDTVTISLKNASVVDQFTFPGGAGGNLGTAGVPARLSFDISYSKSGGRRHVEPTSHDSLSPFNWEGEMWDATNSGSFDLSYSDGSFSAQGSFDSARNFGEIGFERNGSFVQREERDEEGHDASVPGSDNLAGSPGTPNTVQKLPNVALAQNVPGGQQPPSGPKLKGKISIRELIH